MKALSLFANVGIAETYLRARGVDVKTAKQFGNWLKFRETSHLESWRFSLEGHPPPSAVREPDLIADSP